VSDINLEVGGTKVSLEPVTAQTFSLTVPSAVPAVITALATGPQGPGVPFGGTTGQLLVKASDVSFDTEWTDTPSARRVSFSTSNAAALDAAGDLAWDDLDQALSYRTDGLTVDIGQENLIYVRNAPGDAPITRGMAVSFQGASANRINVRPCVANQTGVGCATAGVALTNIEAGSFGFVSTFGLVRGFNTNNILTDGGPPVTEGQELFISTTPGVIATFPAVSPARRVTVGYVVTTGTNGSIFVTVRRGLTVNELDNVLAASPSNGQALVWNASLGVWQPGAIDAVTSVNGETGAVVLDAADVGAYPATGNPSGFVDAAGAAAAAPVQSVNGDVGEVEVTPSSIGAYPDTNPSGFVNALEAADAAPVQSVNGLLGTVVLDAAAVGAYADDNPDGFVDAAGAAAAAPVQSVNGLQGTVLITAGDLGAYLDSNPDGFVDVAGAAAAAPVQLVNGLSGTVLLDAAAVGAYADTNPAGYIDASGAPVQSVNGLAGTVVLDAAAVGAYPDDNPAGYIDVSGAPVQSVNGAAGTVVLVASDVGAVGTAVGVVVYDYGTAIPTVRPDAAAVYWRGTAAPGTAISLAGDIWYDTTGD
jgi:hypothetical protein